MSEGWDPTPMLLDYYRQRSVDLGAHVARLHADLAAARRQVKERDEAIARLTRGGVTITHWDAATNIPGQLQIWSADD